MKLPGPATCAYQYAALWLSWCAGIGMCRQDRRRLVVQLCVSLSCPTYRESGEGLRRYFFHLFCSGSDHRKSGLCITGVIRRVINFGGSHGVKLFVAEVFAAQLIPVKLNELLALPVPFVVI